MKPGKKKKALAISDCLSGMDTIFIKTYLFESGLFYLAKSLGEQVESLGKKVFYLPKERFVLDGAIYKSTYPSARFDLGIDKDKVLSLNNEVAIKTTTLHKVNKYKPDAIISFETFTGKSDWISYCQKAGTKVIDVPMLEWVNKHGFYGKSYKLFDQVWCLNDYTFKTFSNTYSDVQNKIKNVRWDFISEEPSELERDITFIHFGATNDGLDVKNTAETLRAFQKLSTLRDDISFVYVGKYNKIQDSVSNLTSINDYISREKVIELLNRSRCVVSPSLREGLGLSIYEGIKFGCKVITTNSEPMNEPKGLILCKPNYLKADSSMVPMSIVNDTEIFNSMLTYLSKHHAK